MPYPEMMVAPMRQDLARLGIQELKTAAEVDAWMNEKTGSGLLVINSVCGCAAGAARPAVALALQNAKKPDRVATVFAGQDVDAVARARSYFPELPPSSPSYILIKDGQMADFFPRHRIETRDAQTIAADLVDVFNRIA